MRAAVALTPEGKTSLLSMVSASERGSWTVVIDGELLTVVNGNVSDSSCLVRQAGDDVLIRGDAPAAVGVFYRLGCDEAMVDTDLDRLVANAPPDGLDAESLLHFLWRGRPLAGRTLYQGIRRLGRGEELVFAPSKRPLVRRIDWNLARTKIRSDQRNGPLVAETLKRVRSAVRETASPKSAVLLSGGVDSSMLAALAAQQGLNPTGYTVEFDATYGLNETQYAVRVASSIGISHRTVNLSAAKALRHLDSILNASRPRAAPAAITQAHLIERISNDGHECVLSGLGADECFGGYHKALEHLASTSHHVTRYGDDLSTLYSLPLSRLLRLRDALFFGIAEFYSLQEIRSIAVNPARVSQLAIPDLDYYRGALKHKPDAHALELMASHEYAFRLDELLLPAFGSGPEAPIVKYPFLSAHVYPWASSLDPGLCYWHEGGAWWAKRLLRAAAAKLLPADIVMRQRQVFLAPLAHWLLERAWRSRISEEIADSPLWRLEVVRKDVRDGLLQKIARYSSVDTSSRWQEQLWVLLALCAWVNRRTSNEVKLTK